MRRLSRRRDVEDAALTTVAGALAAATRARTESRGCHHRADFPDTDPAQGAAVAQAFATHDRYRPLQEARVRRALDGLHWTADGGIAFDPDPIARAASLIEGLIRR